jgi:hypothetical protein
VKGLDKIEKNEGDVKIKVDLPYHAREPAAK